MMVNCPKCGFSQPQDQYCAKCGVDMVAFRARPKPVNLLGNIPLQIGAFAVVAIVAGLYLHSASKDRAAHIAAETPIARDVDAQESQLAAAQAQQNEARRLMNETSSASVAVPASAAAEGAAPAAPQPVPGAAGFVQAAAPGNVGTGTTSPGQPSPAQGIKSALASAQNVRVYYIEASRQLLQQIMADSHDGAPDGSFGVVNDLDQKLKSARGWQTLDTDKDQPMKLNQPNMFLNATHDQVSGQNVGLTVQVIPLSRDEAGTHLQIDANRTLRDESFNFSLPESFLIPKGGSFVLVGALPHRDLAPGEAQLYGSVNVLKSMTGTPFHSGTTDVAIIVEAR